MSSLPVGRSSSVPLLVRAEQPASERALSGPTRLVSPKSRERLQKLFGDALPATAVLQDQFLCALKRRGLLQGHLYLFDTHLAFSSTILFGAIVTRLVIPLRSITAVSKHSNMGFPNSIKIHRGAFKDVFTSFLSRGAAYELITRLVEEARLQPSVTSPTGPLTPSATLALMPTSPPMSPRSSNAGGGGGGIKHALTSPLASPTPASRQQHPQRDKRRRSEQGDADHDTAHVGCAPFLSARPASSLHLHTRICASSSAAAPPASPFVRPSAPAAASASTTATAAAAPQRHATGSTCAASLDGSTASCATTFSRTTASSSTHGAGSHRVTLSGCLIDRSKTTSTFGAPSPAGPCPAADPAARFSPSRATGGSASGPVAANAHCRRSISPAAATTRSHTASRSPSPDVASHRAHRQAPATAAAAASAAPAAGGPRSAPPSPPPAGPPSPAAACPVAALVTKLTRSSKTCAAQAVQPTAGAGSNRSEVGAARTDAVVLHRRCISSAGSAHAPHSRAHTLDLSALCSNAKDATQTPSDAAAPVVACAGAAAARPASPRSTSSGRTSCRAAAAAAAAAVGACAAAGDVLPSAFANVAPEAVARLCVRGQQGAGDPVCCLPKLRTGCPATSSASGRQPGSRARGQQQHPQGDTCQSRLVLTFLTLFVSVLFVLAVVSVPVKLWMGASTARAAAAAVTAPAAPAAPAASLPAPPQARGGAALDGAQAAGQMVLDAAMVLRQQAAVLLREFAELNRGLAAVSQELGAVAGGMRGEGGQGCEAGSS